VTVEDLLVVVLRTLDELRVPFMLSGSLASNFYGVPRATQDADIVVELDRVPVGELSRRLGERFEVDTQLSFETVTASRRLLIRSRDSAFQVELFGLTDDSHDRERFARRRKVQLLDIVAAVPTAEDVIINKLRWWKAANRRKDIDDARNVLAVQRTTIDREYIVNWCARLELIHEFNVLERSVPQ
jgi:hypothetical protein